MSTKRKLSFGDTPQQQQQAKKNRKARTAELSRQHVQHPILDASVPSALSSPILHVTWEFDANLVRHITNISEVTLDHFDAAPDGCYLSLNLDDGQVFYRHANHTATPCHITLFITAVRKWWHARMCEKFTYAETLDDETTWFQYIHVNGTGDVRLFYLDIASVPMTTDHELPLLAWLSAHPDALLALIGELRDDIPGLYTELTGRWYCVGYDKHKNYVSRPDVVNEGERLFIGGTLVVKGK